jgi:hypothetical protein
MKYCSIPVQQSDESKRIFSASAWPEMAISVIGGKWPESHNPTHQKLPPTAPKTAAHHYSTVVL